MVISPSIGVVAPSSKVPLVELKLGVAKIREKGFRVKVHSQCKKSHLFFAGTDEERAQALFDYAKDPEVSVIWCARGGHGALRLLPLLDRWMQLEPVQNERGGLQKKLLIGYSDVTALMDYVRKNWGWSTLHAQMPSARKFSILGETDWQALSHWIRQKSAPAPWARQRLTFWTPPPAVAIEAPLVGGNLTVWNCLSGTPYQGSASGCFLFFEDIDESVYRIDRMMQQLLLSKRLENVRGIILGNFLNCKDHSPLVLKAVSTQWTEKRLQRVLIAPQTHELKPLRKVIHEKQALRKIFSELGHKLGIPVVFGLPVGHGPEVSPLPLGARYRLLPTGFFELISWDWINSGVAGLAGLAGLERG